MFVFSDSVLSLGGRCREHHDASNTWDNGRISEVVQSQDSQPEYVITGTPVEFVWKIYVVKTTAQILERTKTVMEEKGTKPAQFSRQDHFHVQVQRQCLGKRTTRTSVARKQSASHSAQKTSNQDTGHLLDLEKKVVWKHDKPNRREGGNRLVSVNQFSIYRAVLIWYVEKRSEWDNISPNTDLNISQESVTKITRHETSYLYCLPSRDRSFLIQKINQWNSSRAEVQFSRGAGVRKSEEVLHFFVARPAIVLEWQGITRTCRESSAMHDDFDAGRKGVLEEVVPFSGTSTRSLIAIWTIRQWGADRYRDWRWIEILTCVTEISGNCKQYMFTETVTQQEEIGSGRGICFKIKGKVTTCGKFGIKFSYSKTSSDTSWWRWAVLCRPNEYKFLVRILRREIPCVNRSQKKLLQKLHDQFRSKAGSGDISFVGETPLENHSTFLREEWKY